MWILVVIADYINGVFFRIERQLKNQTDDDTKIQVKAVPGNIRTFTNEGLDLQPFTEYEYRLIVVNQVGEASSAWSPIRWYIVASCTSVKLK